MHNRTAPIVATLVAVALVTACSMQPTSPSSLSATATAAASDSPASSSASRHVAVSGSRFGDREPGVIYVTSQGLYYDTFVLKDPLPMEGKFQPLVDGQTEFGPGQSGYLGGRWWVDENGNGVQDAGDRFFLCPLLPPGRLAP